MRRRSLGLLAGAGALALAPPAAEAAPLTDGDVALDVFQGAAVGSVRVVGMGGTVTALAEGSAGTLANPASAAIRATTSTSRWDWDFHLDGVAGRDGGDLDNDGLAQDGRQALGTTGLAIYRGRFGLAISTVASDVVIDDGSATTLNASAIDTRAAEASAVLYYLPADDAIGAGVLAVGGGPMGAPRLPWYVAAELRRGSARLITLAAAELAGATRLSYPVDTRLIRLRCSARFDPIHILWALLNGADGVFLGACALGDCHYVDGNRYAQERIFTLRDLLAKNGFDPRRLRLEWIVPDDPHDFVKKVSDFTDLVRKL